MGKRKDKNALGRALINNKAKPPHMQQLQQFSVDPTVQTHVGTNLRSVTEQSALEAFLTDAVLRNADFTASRDNAFIVTPEGVHNPDPPKAVVVSDNWIAEDIAVEITQIPRRPEWDETTTTEELDANERASFLEWRRVLAALEEEHKLLLTPFEKNLEVWRQLWRVIERSDVVIQIVDARNPLLFRSKDLEMYVQELDESKKNILVINKADLLTTQLRTAWATYFKNQGVDAIFFSAKTEQSKSAEVVDPDAVVQTNQTAESTPNTPAPPNTETTTTETAPTKSQTTETETAAQTTPKQTTVPKDKNHVYSSLELIELLEKLRPPHKESVVVGMVGFPNVGKSSTLNTLFGQKKVAVSATPGKTKHFQTLRLTPTITVCDCPGLVFPRVAVSKAEMVLDGVVPIDHLKDCTTAMRLLCARVPRKYFEDLYGVCLPIREGSVGEDAEFCSASELLCGYAVTRGYMTSRALPDEARAARRILKDYVNGALLFCHFPPTSGLQGVPIATTFGEEAEVLKQPEPKLTRTKKPQATASTQYHEEEFDVSAVQAHAKTGSKKKLRVKAKDKQLPVRTGAGDKEGVFGQPTRKHLPMPVNQLRAMVRAQQGAHA